jgi:Rrf2 family protein
VQLSCKTEYAILALLELTGRYQIAEPLQIRQIAAAQNIPDRYLEQLLASLRRGGLIVSHRGAKGGYLLAREPWKITLLDAIECLEGSDSKVGKTNESSTKTLESQVIKEVWQEAHQKAMQVLASYTLQDLWDKKGSRNQLEFMYYI